MYRWNKPVSDCNNCKRDLRKLEKKKEREHIKWKMKRLFSYILGFKLYFLQYAICAELTTVTSLSFPAIIFPFSSECCLVRLPVQKRYCLGVTCEELFEKQSWVSQSTNPELEHHVISHKKHLVKKLYLVFSWLSNYFNFDFWTNFWWCRWL